MSIRSLVLLSCVVTTFSLATSASADVPPSTGSGGSSSASTGAGGIASDPDCTIARESVAGATCVYCVPAGAKSSGTTPACSSLDSKHFFSCQQSASIQVWCDGPQRNAPSDQNVAKCSVTAPGSTWSGLAACGALAVAAALRLRRRR